MRQSERLDDLVKKLIRKDNENKSIELINATRDGHKEIVEWLVANGATIDYKERLSGLTALMYAILNERKDIVEYLVNNGASVNSNCGSGKSPLNIALRNFEIAEFLIENGANVNCQLPQPEGCGLKEPKTLVCPIRRCLTNLKG